MANKMDKGQALYELMIRKGYPESFSRIISSELHTDFTAGRMISYLCRAGKRPLEEVADEMYAILSDRDHTMEKHINEHAQSKINDLYRNFNE